MIEEEETTCKCLGISFSTWIEEEETIHAQKLEEQEPYQTKN